MARSGPDLRILALATAVVLALAATLAGGAWYLLSHHPSARSPVAGAGDADAAPLPMPETVGPRCAGPVLGMVSKHPSKTEGATVNEAVTAKLEAAADERGLRFLALGWRGREDRERADRCRVSFRYQLGEERGASVWLVDTEAPPYARLEPQDRLSVETTALIDWPDPEAQKTARRRCADDGVDRVMSHFSYMENFSIWRTLRKRAGQIRRETGVEIIYDRWYGLAEAPDRCLVAVSYWEDKVGRKAWFRLRYLPNGEHEVIPLTPRAIEAIYGPGVTTR